VAVLLISFGFLVVSLVGEWGVVIEVALADAAMSSTTHGGTGAGNSTSSTGSMCSTGLGAGFGVALGTLMVYWNLLPFLFGCIGTALLIWVRADLHRAEAQGESSAVSPQEAPYVHRGIFAKGPILGVLIVTVIVPLLIMLSGLFICL
jgi:hypothetical protein